MNSGLVSLHSDKGGFSLVGTHRRRSHRAKADAGARDRVRF